jgi:hypothetical protein
MARSSSPEDLDTSTRRLAATARRALGRAAGREVPEEMARAVAQGAGDRARLATASHDLFGAGVKPLALVLFDTHRIASFVFESIRPPVLAGASKILRDLNRHIEEENPEAIVYSGGGEGMLLVEAQRAPALCEHIERRFAEKSGGALGVTVASLPVSPEDFVAAPGAEATAARGVRLVAGTQAVLARLRDRVQISKEERIPARPAVGERSERCVSCRDRAAGSTPSRRTDRDLKPEGYLCDPCSLRWEEGAELIDGNSFDDLVKTFQDDALGKRARGARAQYLGFLYADGNAMGNLFGCLASLSELRFASRAIARVFAGADRRARQEVASLMPVERSQHPPLLSLLGGGDEVIWIAPGALAVRLAAKLARWIADEAAAIPGLGSLLAAHATPRLTFGAGLVLCDRGFPVRYQHELAEALRKSAKAMFQGAPAADVASSIDFAVLTESSPWSEDLAAVRRLAYRTEDEDFVRTCRPYRYEDFAHLLCLARRANEKGIGKSQLHSLQVGATEGRKVFLNYLRYQIARHGVGRSYRAWMDPVAVGDPAAVEAFFLRRLPGAGEREKWGTWIPDLLDLKPFVDLLEGAADD